MRILVVARPSDGRPVEAVLRGAGYEVHRTPVDADLELLVWRLRPHLVIIALNIPWGEGVTAVQPLLEGAWPRSILLLGETASDARVVGLPRLPLGVEPGRLLAAVNCLLAAPDGVRED